MLIRQALVHRTHLSIFGGLFPPTMRNWHLDDWISTVYGPAGTMHIPDVRIRNTNRCSSPSCTQPDFRIFPSMNTLVLSRTT